MRDVWGDFIDENTTIDFGYKIPYAGKPKTSVKNGSLTQADSVAVLTFGDEAKISATIHSSSRAKKGCTFVIVVRQSTQQ